MNRRGFLSLVGFGAAAVAIEASIPAPFRRALAPAVRERITETEMPMVMRYVMAFAGELAGLQEVVAPGGLTRLVCQPQLVFRPDRLIFAPSFELADFDVMPWTDPERPELGSALIQPVPAEAFKPTSWGMQQVAYGVVRPGEQIVLELQNRSNHEALAPASAHMVGTAIR